MTRKRFCGLLAGLQLSLAFAVPASAYRVFLDHDTDGDLTTFSNSVESELSAPITYVVVFDSTDVDVTEVSFWLSWGCAEAGSIVIAQGSILDDCALMDMPPFHDIGESVCTAYDCGCVAGRDFWASVSAPPPIGYYAFGTQELSRLGNDAQGNPFVHNGVVFEVCCSQCDYETGDEAYTTMTFGTPTSVSEATEVRPWGSTKALYRE